MVSKMPEKTDIERLKTAVAKLKRDISGLNRSNSTLTADKRILDEILDNLPGTFYIWDDQRRLIRWNRRHEEITGYSSDDYVNMQPTDFFDKHEHQEIEASVEKTFADGETTIEATLVTKSGKKIPHLYSAVRTMIGDKPVLMGFGIDISKQKKAEQQLRSVLSQMEVLQNQLEAESAYLQEEIKLEHNFENIIGQSDVLKYVLYKVEQVASTDAIVLILGETGTGKELMARAVHSASSRNNRPLIKVNCAALPPNLIESELFGHEKGAFTSAQNRQIGRFELANGATLFLDEIGELPLEIQAKLLRVLQDGEFERLGSSKTLKTDARIIAASNRDLEAEVKNGRFRSDLWYRLNVFPITVPPLREHPQDIPLLVDWFVERYSKKHGKKIKTVPARIIRAFKKSSWPGNVRELENVIERAVINTLGGKLQLADVIGTVGAELQAPDYDQTLEEMEREYILKIVKKTHWRIEGPKGAAQILGLKTTTLRSRMKKLGIERPH